MTAPTPTDSGGRYWAVVNKDGKPFTPAIYESELRAISAATKDMVYSKEYDYDGAWHLMRKMGYSVTEFAAIPASSYTRLLAIEAAARNALDNSWPLLRDGLGCEHDEWSGCTVLDPKDARELKDALLTPAVSGEHTKGKTDE